MQEISFKITKRTDIRLLRSMGSHYSKPKGFVGRNICHSIEVNGVYYGHIVAGSSTLHLSGRHEFLRTTKEELNSIINNIFYHIEKNNGKYPFHNFVSLVIKKWVDIIQCEWFNKYGDLVIGFESLVEIPRTGECYRRAGWTEVGQTKGYTCKRVAGKGSDSWSGKRIWCTSELRPKRIFCLKV